MKSFLSTSLITLGAFTLATTTASAQATITALPVDFDSFQLSPSGTTVSGSDGTFVGRWSAGVFTPLLGNGWDMSFAGNMNFDGSIVVGSFEDSLSMTILPGYNQTGVGDVSIGLPIGYADGCTLTSTANSVSWDGTVIGGSAVLGCNTYPFRWNSTTGFQVLDTSSPIVPSAVPSAKALATSGDGLVSAGWIQTSARSGAVWDAAGVLSFPFVTAINTDGNGEIFAMDFTGDTVVGNSFVDGPVVVNADGIHSPAIDAGFFNSGEGMLDVSADGAVAVGAGGGATGPFGSPDTGLVWTSWSGGQDINALFANYGVTLPSGLPVNRAVGISLDAHTFLVQEPPAGFGYGDSYLVTLPNSWNNLGGASPAGINGIPQLRGQGYLTDGAAARLTLSQSAAGSASFLALSATDNPMPLWGGVLHTTNYFKLINLNTNATGGAEINFTWPNGLAGVTLYSQMATLDFSVPANITLSNALASTGF